jgi:hypothetical protein
MMLVCIFILAFAICGISDHLTNHLTRNLAVPCGGNTCNLGLAVTYSANEERPL